MTNSRSLYGDDLANLFLLVNKDKSVQYDHLLMNVASNLRTLSVNLFAVSDENSDLEKFNTLELERDRRLK